MPEGETFVTVRVSIELLAQLKDEWSPPVQLQIERYGDEYTMIARTHTCRGLDLDRLLGIKWDAKFIDPTEVVYVLRDPDDELRITP